MGPSAGNAPTPDLIGVSRNIGGKGVQLPLPGAEDYGLVGFGVARMNGDNFADIISMNRSQPYGLRVWLSDGNFGVTDGGTADIDGLDPVALSIADFNGNGTNDVAVTAQILNGGRTYVLLGDGQLGQA